MSTYPRRVPPSAFAAHRNRPPLPPSHASRPSGQARGGMQHVSIPDLREAIHSLDSKMATLMSQRHELESHLEKAVRLQSPIHRLPSELLASIFVIGVLGIDENPVLVSTLMLVW